MAVEGIIAGGSVTGNLSVNGTLSAEMTIPKSVKVQANKNVTPANSQLIVLPDDGYDAMAQCTVSGAPDTYADVLIGNNATINVSGTIVQSQGNKGKINLSMPDVETVGDYAFEKVKFGTFNAPKLKTIGNYAFNSAEFDGTIVLPALTSMGTKILQGVKCHGVNAQDYTGIVDVSNVDASNYDINFEKATEVASQGLRGAKCRVLDLSKVTTLGTSALQEMVVSNMIYLDEYVGVNNTDSSSSSSLFYGLKIASLTLPKLKYANYGDFRLAEINEVRLPALEIAGRQCFIQSKVSNVYLDAVTAIKKNAFQQNMASGGFNLYIGSSAVPTCATDAFSGIDTWTVHVPADMYDLYIADTVWGSSGFSSHIVGDYVPAVNS